MFIALSTRKTIAPFGGAECYWMSTYQVEFRPSERRWIDGWTPSYKYFTPTGLPGGPLLARYRYDFEKARQKNKKL
jgi:hypothetical protein